MIMLNKLLFKNQDRKQLIIAMIGAFLGITFLVTSIHYLIKVNEFGQGSEILGPNTIIVQKKVSSSSTLGLTSTTFSENELAKIRSEKFIDEVKPVICNNFNISLQTDDPLVPYFRTDIFIQTVDPEFIDVDTKEWKWKEGDSSVPIIMPRDFLVMLNTFMSASGINQVSDDLAKKIKFKFTLFDDDKKEWVDAQIIGFTNEVSAILVPESFMQYGIDKYSNGEEQKITQIMISGKENEFGKVEELLISKGLESKNSQMVVGRLKSIIGTLFLVIMGISIIAVFMSGLVLIQYLQLLISRNAYEVRTLLRIGYPPKEMIRRFFIYFTRIFGIVSLVGLLLFGALKFLIDEVFKTGGIYIDESFTMGSIGALLIAYLLFMLASFFTAKRGIFNEY
jgi:hypothetical protein